MVIPPRPRIRLRFLWAASGLPRRTNQPARLPRRHRQHRYRKSPRVTPVSRNPSPRPDRGTHRALARHAARGSRPRPTVPPAHSSANSRPSARCAIHRSCETPAADRGCARVHDRAGSLGELILERPDGAKAADLDRRTRAPARNRLVAERVVVGQVRCAAHRTEIVGGLPWVERGDLIPAQVRRGSQMAAPSLARKANSEWIRTVQRTRGSEANQLPPSCSGSQPISASNYHRAVRPQSVDEGVD